MMGPRTFLAITGLVLGGASWAVGFAIHGLPGADWMNWKGWGWIFGPINMAFGVWFGWDVRGTHERSRRWREDLERQRGGGGP